MHFYWTRFAHYWAKEQWFGKRNKTVVVSSFSFSKKVLKLTVYQETMNKRKDSLVIGVKKILEMVTRSLI